MKGQQHVIDMRLDGFKPRAVFIQLDDTPSRGWEANPRDFDYHPFIFIEPGEAIGPLDFRFLVGLQVHLSGSGTLLRLIECAHRVKQCNPATVIATFFDRERDAVTYLNDTRNNYTWQAPTT